MQVTERFGDLGRELDAGQAAADDRDASALRCGLLQRLMNGGDGTELHRHRVLTHALDAVHIDVGAEREHECVELDPLGADMEHAIAVIDLLDAAHT